MPIFAVAVILTVLAVVLLARWRKLAAKARQNQEQINRKLRESDLDQALSNGVSYSDTAQAQVPVEIHYASKGRTENRAMLRLTEQTASVTKAYLFQRNETFFLGEEYGRAAVFREQGKNAVCCEVFSYQGNVYARRSGRDVCRLLRGKKTMPLTEKAFLLRSGDRLATRTGVFLVEMI